MKENNMRRMQGVLVMGLMACFLVLSSCGGGGSDDGVKSIFSKWETMSTAGITGGVLDFRGQAFSEPFEVSVFFTGGLQCDCMHTLVGQETTGRLIINQCGSPQGLLFSPCNGFIQTTDYSLSSENILTLTESGGSVSVWE